MPHGSLASAVLRCPESPPWVSLGGGWAFNNHNNHVLTTKSLLIPFDDKPVLPSEVKRETADLLLPLLVELFLFIMK